MFQKSQTFLYAFSHIVLNYINIFPTIPLKTSLLRVYYANSVLFVCQSYLFFFFFNPLSLCWACLPAFSLTNNVCHFTKASACFYRLVFIFKTNKFENTNLEAKVTAKKSWTLKGKVKLIHDFEKSGMAKVWIF